MEERAGDLRRGEQTIDLITAELDPRRYDRFAPLPPLREHLRGSAAAGQRSGHEVLVVHVAILIRPHTMKAHPGKPRPAPLHGVALTPGRLVVRDHQPPHIPERRRLLEALRRPGRWGEPGLSWARSWPIGGHPGRRARLGRRRRRITHDTMAPGSAGTLRSRSHRPRRWRSPRVDGASARDARLNRPEQQGRSPSDHNPAALPSFAPHQTSGRQVSRTRLGPSLWNGRLPALRSLGPERPRRRDPLHARVRRHGRRWRG